MQKGAAHKKVKSLRQHGKRARVVKTKSGHVVYTDGKRAVSHKGKKGHKGHSSKGVTVKHVRKAVTKAITECKNGSGKVAKACVQRELGKYL